MSIEGRSHRPLEHFLQILDTLVGRIVRWIFGAHFVKEITSLLVVDSLLNLKQDVVYCDERESASIVYKVDTLVRIARVKGSATAVVLDTIHLFVHPKSRNSDHQPFRNKKRLLKAIEL
jgi:hypothetical protein